MKIICVGRNYSSHIDELKNEKPQQPVLFIKPDTALIQRNQPFFIPHFTSEIHYEVELLVRIHRLGKHIQPKFAHKYYNDIALGIDFTARAMQTALKEKGLPWEKAKAFDGSALVSDWLPKTRFEDLNHLNFSLEKNGTPVQSGNTSQMLWDIDHLIAHISEFFTLKIGDIIFTGTPAGVEAVSPGDTLTGFIEGQQQFSVKIK